MSRTLAKEGKIDNFTEIMKYMLETVREIKKKHNLYEEIDEIKSENQKSKAKYVTLNT